MPQAAAAAAWAWAAEAFGSVAVANVVGFAVYAVAIVAVNVAIGYAARALTGSGQSNSGTVDNLPINVTMRGTTVPRRIVFGTRRVSGAMAFYGASSSNGLTNDYLWYVVALAGHQVSAIHDIWIGTDFIPESWFDSYGSCITGKYAGKLSVWKYLGTSQQMADPNLVAAFPEWDATHRGQSVAYIVVRCQKDDVAYAQGPPQDIGALVDGLLYYDPRQDSTNGGSGSQRSNDASTWTFNRNATLASRWWLSGGSIINDVATPMPVYGIGEDDEHIDDAYTIAAANVCDESIAGSLAVDPAVPDQIRYLCDLEAATDQPDRQVLTDIQDSMGGSAVVVHGKWRLHAGAYETPIHTLTQDDLYDDLQVVDTDSRADRYNAVSATFVDFTQQYIEQTTPYRTDEDYEAQDGGERIPLDIQLKAVVVPWQAQRLCEIRLRQSRMMRKVVLPGAMNLLKVALQEGIYFSHLRYGWTNRVFRCTDRQFEFDKNAGVVTVTAIRDDSGVWADMAPADYTSGTSATDVYQDDGPATPENFTATSLIDAIRFDWTMPYDSQVSQVQIFQHTAPTPFEAATLLTTVGGTSYTLNATDRVTRYYWIRAFGGGTRVSGTNPEALGLPARAVNRWETASALSTQAWLVGTTGGQGNFIDRGNTVPYSSLYNKGLIVLAGQSGAPLGPRNTVVPLWKVAGNVGGWDNYQDLYGVDPARSYRFGVSFYLSNPNNPEIQVGCNGLFVEQLNGADPGEGLFWKCPAAAGIIANRWYLVLGVINGRGYAGPTSIQSGVYDYLTGQKVPAGNGSTDGVSGLGFHLTSGDDHGGEFRFKTGIAIPYISQSVRIQPGPGGGGADMVAFLTAPRCDEINGNEPSLSSLLGPASTVPLTGAGGTLDFWMQSQLVKITSGYTAPSAMFSGGASFILYNDTGGTLTLTQGSGLTMRLGGTTTTGSRTLAARGTAYLNYMDTNTVVVTGNVT